MATIIKLKRGTSTPSTSDITNGEVAVDTSAKKIYINDSGTVERLVEVRLALLQLMMSLMLVVAVKL